MTILFNHIRDYYTNTNVMQEGRVITCVNTIAERLKKSRDDLNLSQEQLAVNSGVKQGTIGNIESGIRKNPRELLSIARALGVNPEWLKTGKGPKNPSPAVLSSVLDADSDPVIAAMEQLGLALIRASKLSRRQAGPVFEMLVSEPEKASQWGEQLSQTLAIRSIIGKDKKQITPQKAPRAA